MTETGKVAILKRKFNIWLKNPHFIFHWLYHPIDKLFAFFAVIRSTRKYKKAGELYGPYRIDHLPYALQRVFKSNFFLPMPRLIRERKAGDDRNSASQFQIPAICRKYMPYVNHNYEKNWPISMINELVAAAKARIDFSCEEYPFSVLQHYKALGSIETANKKALVVGSISPWVESILLAYGVAAVCTTEYGVILCDHPEIKTVDRLKDTPPPSGSFDLICSFSSIEHSGLGRYGDRIDPFGDLKAMEEIHHWLVPGGLALIGVPVSDRNLLIGNGHRLYSENYLKHHLFKGFNILGSIPYPINDNEINYSGYDGQNQPLFVLKKPNI